MSAFATTTGTLVRRIRLSVALISLNQSKPSSSSSGWRERGASSRVAIRQLARVANEVPEAYNIAYDCREELSRNVVLHCGDGSTWRCPMPPVELTLDDSLNVSYVKLELEMQPFSPPRSTRSSQKSLALAR